MEKSDRYGDSVENATERSRSLRVKVTERCPWRCSFCHDEGGLYSKDLHWSPRTEEVILALQEVIPDLREVHYTGGEPTNNKHLAALTMGLVSLGLEVKTTTNGQFDKEKARELMAAGLHHYNFSVLTTDPEFFLKIQSGRSILWNKNNMGDPEDQIGVDYNSKNPKTNRLEWAQAQIDRQLGNILYLKEIGAKVKINTTVTEIPNAMAVMKWAKEHNVTIRLLPVLGDGGRSMQLIQQLLRDVGAEEILRKADFGSSSASVIYKTADAYEFGVKYIRDKKLESMCKKCRRAADGSCQEQFYGVRLQLDEKGDFKVVLCIQEKMPETVMNIEEFLNSPQLKEIVDTIK